MGIENRELRNVNRGEEGRLVHGVHCSSQFHNGRFGEKPQKVHQVMDRQKRKDLSTASPGVCTVAVISPVTWVSWFPSLHL